MSQKLSAVQKRHAQAQIDLASKEKTYEAKLKSLESELETKTGVLAKRVEALVQEKQVVQRNYDDQIKMLSDHIVELSAKESVNF